MSARKLGKAWWVDFRHNFQRYRKKSPDNTRMGAQAYEATLRAALARGENVDASEKEHATPTRFAKFAARWLGTYVRANNKPSEAKTKELMLRLHLVPAFGTLMLSEVTTARIEAFKQAQLARGLHPKTVNNHLVALLKCLRCAFEWGELERLPVSRTLKAPPPPFRSLDRAEQTRLLEAAKSEPFWRPMVLVALQTGMRVGELLGLEWQDIDWGRGFITVQRSFVYGVLGTPKNNRVRHIPLTPDALAVLHPLRQPDGPVFRRPDGRRLGATTSGRALSRMAKRVGLEPFGWHTLRHTYATSLAMTGTPLRVVQVLLGHASIVMTERYAHVSPEAMRTAVDALARTFTSSSELDDGQPAGKKPEVVEREHVVHV